MNRFLLLLPLAWRNVWRNRRRTLITLAVVAVGVWSILAFSSLLEAWARSSRDASLNLLTGDGQIHAQGYRDDPAIQHSFATPPAEGALAKVLNGPHVARWSGRVRTPGIVQSEFKTLPITLVGIDPERERGLSFIATSVTQGAYLDGTSGNGILLGRHLAHRLGTGIGKRVVLMGLGMDDALAQGGFRVVGLFQAPRDMEDSVVFIGKAAAQRLLKAPGRLSEIAFKTPTQSDLTPSIQALRKAAPSLDIQPWQILQPLTKAVSNLSDGFVMVWLWIMFVLMALGIVNTQLMSVFERVREFGLLQALGLRPGDVMREVLAESCLLVGLGVVLGVLAAVMTVGALHGGINLGFLAKGAEWLGAQHVLYPRINGTEYLVLSVVIWGLSMLASLWPSWRAGRYSPQEAMSRT